MHYVKPTIYHHYMIMHFKDFHTNYHLIFNSGYLIEFVCLKSDLINNSDN